MYSITAMILSIAFLAGCGPEPLEGAVDPKTGNFMQPCHSDGSCNPPLACASDYRGASVSYCVDLVGAADCGRPGQPCCKSYSYSSGYRYIAEPCSGANECLFFCFSGIRCSEGNQGGNYQNRCAAD